MNARASQPRQNPFTPSFGEVPPFLAGRERLLAELDAALGRDSRSPELTTIISGARGTGKTALLSKLAGMAQQHGWVTVKTAAAPGMLEDIFQHAARDSRHLVDPGGPPRQLTGIGFGQLVSLEWSSAPADPSNWRIRMESLIGKLEERGSGLLVAVDEVDASVDEMVQLASVYQLLVMDDRKVALIMAGLPHNIERAKGNRRISFVRRAQQRRLGRIEDFEVRRAMRKTVEQGGRSIGDEALDAAVEAAGGFPFMFQLVGYRMWEESPGAGEVSLRDVRAGADLAMREMRSSVLESTYRELSDGDIDFLKAMLEDDGPSSPKDIAARLGKPSGHVGTYRERLLRAGVIGEPDRNALAFELPGFRDFLADRLGLDGSGPR